MSPRADLERSTRVTPAEARDALRAVQQIRGQTNGTLRSHWFPLVVSGILSAGSAPACMAGEVAIVAYWLFGATLGSVIVARHYRQREREIGIGRSGVPYLATAAGILAVAAVAGASGSPTLQVVGPALAAAAGYLMFAWLERSRMLGVVSVVLAAVAALLAVGEVTADACVTLGLLFGGVLLTTGWLARCAEAKSG